MMTASVSSACGWCCWRRNAAIATLVAMRATQAPNADGCRSVDSAPSACMNVSCVMSSTSARSPTM